MLISGSGAQAANQLEGLENGGRAKGRYQLIKKIDRQGQGGKSLLQPMVGCGFMPEEHFSNECGNWASFEVVQLPGVEVTGRSYYSGWVTVCVGYECADLFTQLGRQPGLPQGWFEQMVVAASDIGDPAGSACNVASLAFSDDAKKLIANTTSKSSPSDRHATAVAVWGLTGGGVQAAQMIGPSHPINTAAYRFNSAVEFTVTFADGGQESYFHIIVGPSDQLQSQPKAGSLKEGDGQSKCPA